MERKFILFIASIVIGLSLLLPFLFILSFGEFDMPFETVSKGYFSHHTNKKNYVINSQDEWEELWNFTFSIIEPIPNIPPISFTRDTIIAVYLGERPSSGYTIEIKKIIKKKSDIVVYVEETSPDPSGIVADVMTNPYHIIKIRKIIDENIQFSISSKIT